MSWVNTVLQIIQLVPSVLQLIIQIENAFKGVQANNPGVKFGDAKKALVTDTLVSSGANDKTQAALSTFTDKAVATLNTKGFSTKDQSFG